MYLHQSNNLNNGINLSSNHTLNSLTNSLKMSDLHNNAFHNHLNSNQSPTSSPSSHQLNQFTNGQNEENYLENFSHHYQSNGGSKLNGGDQFDYSDHIVADKMNSFSSSSLPITSSGNIHNKIILNSGNNTGNGMSNSIGNSITTTATTLNNITNISNFILTNSIQTKQLNGQQLQQSQSSHQSQPQQQLQQLQQPQLDDRGKADNLMDNCADKSNANKSNVDQNDFTGMDPLTRFMSLHPKYLELYEKFNNFLFNGDGSLQYTVRHYIAIMAAARHHCKYLVNDQQEQFKKVGGDLNWLKGLQFAPKKIQNLNEINKILAHQPWLLTKEHIENLTKGDDNWSLSELMQAIVIMTQFHSLSSFVFGCGFNDVDADLEWLNRTSNLISVSNINSNNISDLLFFNGKILPSSIPSSAPPSPPSNSLVNLNGLLNESILSSDSPLRTLSNNITRPLNANDSSSSESVTMDSNPKAIIQSSNSKVHKHNEQGNSLEILMRKMQNLSEQKQQQLELDNQEELVKNQSLEIHLTPTRTSPNEFNFNSSPTSSLSANPNGQQLTSQVNVSPSQLTSKCLGDDDEQFEISKFVFDFKFCYDDFARQRARTDVTTFKVQDYSWSDHGYSLVNRLYSDVGTMLDEKFTTTYNLTYYTMGRSTNVDTRLFRQAVWNYIQCMYGIRHDDYDYHEINDLLERPLKTYIKTVCCFPHQTRRKDCDEVMSEFRRSEKIHVNIMITEARLQAELLYALRTISRYMT